MRQSTVIGGLLLFVGILIGGYVADQATAQATAIRSSESFFPWPQHPKDIVNLEVEKTLVPGECFTIYEVPEKRWLTVSIFMGNTSVYEVYETIEGVRTQKLTGGIGNMYTGSGVFGDFLAFQPGSSVEVVNRSTSNTIDFVFHMNGFLVRP